MELLAQIKLLSNNSKDDVINLIIDKTKVEIATITKVEYTELMDNVLVDMVVVKLSKLGNEGLNSFSASGSAESYIDGYPKSILRQLDKFIKRVKLL